MDEKLILSTGFWKKKQKKNKELKKSWKIERFGSFGRISLKASEAARLRKRMHEDLTSGKRVQEPKEPEGV
jgi:hypothetical protein